MTPREIIELCQDEGVCYICGRSILWGVDGVYTINGSHYDCEFPEGAIRNREQLSDLVRKMDEKIDSFGLRSTSTQPALAVANGGELLHWVVPATGVALCGHKPKNTAWHMKARGKWLWIKDGADITRRQFCRQGCVEKHAKQYPELQLGDSND